MSILLRYLETRTRRVVIGAFLITALLAVPFLLMAPTESASTEPGGAVFDARDLVDDRFVSSVHEIGFIAEHESGDLLRAEPLTSLLGATRQLGADAEIGPTLFPYYSADAGLQVAGPFSIADLVEAELRTQGVDGLVDATDADVDAAVANLVERYGVDNDVLGLSQLTYEEDGRWVAPALFLSVATDDRVLGFGNTSVNLGGDTDVEEFDRSVQDVLRTAEDWQVNGIAIDVNLTSQEQGAVAGPFIGFTVLAALLFVGLTFRSYWVMATVSVMFVALIIWLKGISNLLGFKDDLVLSLIVPIAMISFGVDYAFHSIGRYREERQAGKRARIAASSGAVAASGALVLATASDSVAFLANATAGIESIVQFGIGAAIALVSAYLLLGLLAPAIVAQIESVVPAPQSGRRAAALRIAGAMGAGMMAMATVLLMVFVLPWLGVVLAAVTAVCILVVPATVQSRRRTGTAVGDLDLAADGSPMAERIGRIVQAIAERRRFVLPVAAVITAIAALFAVQVPTRFDVNDFFAADTDFVVGLNQLDRHVGDRSGEPVTVLVEGELTNPQNLQAIQGHLDDVIASPSEVLARDAAGVSVDAGVFTLFDNTWDSSTMQALVADRSGIELTDADGDRIPDTQQQIEALLAVATESGVPIDAERLAMTPDDVAVAFDMANDSYSTDAIALRFEVVNSQDQMSVLEARRVLDSFSDAVSADLNGNFVQATGSAIVREASLDGASRALAVSLPIAVLACLIVASTFLRSIRYGLASIVPILMVVAWLYAFMELAGFAINLVTATIAAVSIGIGIDFALHYITRYREELEATGVRSAAVRIAGEGTGLALVASAFSSAVGFGILAFAPMPLFASYGMLTALMIMMALVATLVVLPGLLVMITRDAGDGFVETDGEAGSSGRSRTVEQSDLPNGRFPAVPRSGRHEPRLVDLIHQAGLRPL